MDKYLVQVRVLGIMTQQGEREEVETLADGLLRTDGEHFELAYREIAENENEEVKVKILLTKTGIGDEAECRIIKEGPVRSDMLFLKDSQTECLYVTPFGEMLLEVYTYSAEAVEETGNLSVKLNYRLLSQGMPLSEAEVFISAKRKSCPQR